MALPVVLDACILIPMPIADLLLRLADAKQFRPLWSEEILDEVERNLVRQLSVDPAKARVRVSAMREHFPDAMVSEYEALIPVMGNDAKDRHVLAAAVRAGAELIVTDNLKDFPLESLAPFDLAAVSADEFLLDQLDLNPERVLAVAEQIIEDMRSPSMTWEGYLSGLESCRLTQFAGELRGRASR